MYVILTLVVKEGFGGHTTSKARNHPRKLQIYDPRHVVLAPIQIN